MGTNEETAAEVERYLATGRYDVLFRAWTGVHILDRANRGHAAMLEALTEEVKRRDAGAAIPPALAGLDLTALARRKAEPMVRGLFPKAEQDVVLGLVEKSVVFVTPDSIESVLVACDDLSSAWDIANLYLASINAERLGKNASRLVGLSEELTCYVSVAYFEEEDPFADFVVHEIAHLFHNNRRQSLGLPETRKRKCVLDIDYRKRETFAYACEAYSRIMEHSNTPAERRALAEEFAGLGVADDRVNDEEVAGLVRAACERRNGWEIILAHCAPRQSRR